MKKIDFTNSCWADYAQHGYNQTGDDYLCRKNITQLQKSKRFSESEEQMCMI